jgi:hypothetical protein
MMSRPRSGPFWKSALTVVAALAVFGCGSNALATDPTVEAPSFREDGRNDQRRPGERIDRCRPQPHEKVSARIGRRGGRISFGRNQITIPAGALSRLVIITAEVIDDSTNSVRFEPHGLVFAKAVSLKLRYDGCAESNSETHQIIYTDELLNVLESPFSIDHVTDKSVEGEIWHFSRYAVAW